MLRNKYQSPTFSVGSIAINLHLCGSLNTIIFCYVFAMKGRPCIMHTSLPWPNLMECILRPTLRPNIAKLALTGESALVPGLPMVGILLELTLASIKYCDFEKKAELECIEFRYFFLFFNM